MDASLSQIHFWAFSAGALIFGLFALYLGFGWRGGAAGAKLLAAIVLSALWTASAALAVTGGGRAWAMFLSHIFDVGRIAVWSWFLFGLLNVVAPGDVSHRRLRSLRRLAGVGLIAAALAALFGGLVGLEPRWRIFAMLAATIWVLALVEQVYRNFPAGSRWGIKPLCLGLGGIFAFDLYLYAEGFLFSRIDVQIAVVRGLVHALAAPLFAMSAVRSRDWTFRISVSRELVFHSAALAASGVYLLVVAAAGYYVRWFGGEWGPALQATLLFCGLLGLAVVLFSGSFRSRLRVWLNKHLFAYRYDYRTAWLKFTQVLSAPDQSLERSVIGALGDLVESPGGLLFLRDGEDYRAAAALNRRPVEASEPADGAVIALMRDRGWILNLEEWRMQPARYKGVPVPDWLSQCSEAWLVIPLHDGSQLIGFVVLDTARTTVDVNWEVLDLLKTAGKQAASYLGQARTMAALLEAQKFDSFNRMSAFVVHDFKNLVAQLSLMLKNADKHKHKPEFQDDMLMTVAHVVERMRGLMVQLQNKSPIDQQRTLDLAAVCRRVFESRRLASREMRFSGDEGLLVRAHDERLERIVSHVVQNAIEATAEQGRVEIDIRRRDEEAEILVADSGCGMTAEFIRERLFRPFQTTKTTGTGIGAYEVQQYVRELGGRVAVESTPGAGTRFSIYLPLMTRTERVAA